MRLHILADKIPWFGHYSGYNQLVRYFDNNLRVTHSRTTLNQIRIGRFFSRLGGWPWREDVVYAAAELRYRLSSYASHADIYHILFGEGHHYYFERWSTVPKNIIATLHHPPEQWSQHHATMVPNLRRVSSAIVLYQSDIDQFEQLVGRHRVHFIHHGVDTEFFVPNPDAVQHTPRRILYAGQNGRNTDMIYRLVTELSKQHPLLRFDLLVRDTIRQRFEGLASLTHHPAVTWHEGLSDIELRQLYQQSYLLLLPLDCCAATNAIVEALACGLPIVTTTVGGVPDYGGGTIYPIVPNNDDEAMLELVNCYLNEPDWRNQVAIASRHFAEQHLAWPVVARKHLQAYQTLIKQ